MERCHLPGLSAPLGVPSSLQRGLPHTAWCWCWWQPCPRPTAHGTNKGVKQCQPHSWSLLPRLYPKYSEEFYNLRVSKWIYSCYSKLHTDFIQCSLALVLEVPVNFFVSVSLYLNIFQDCSSLRGKNIEKGNTRTVNFYMFRFLLQSNHSPPSMEVIKNSIW